MDFYANAAAQHLSTVRSMTPAQQIAELRACLKLIVHEAGRVDRLTYECAPIQCAIELLKLTAVE